MLTHRERVVSVQPTAQLGSRTGRSRPTADIGALLAALHRTCNRRALSRLLPNSFAAFVRL